MALPSYSNLPMLALVGLAVVFYIFFPYFVAWFRLRHIQGPFLASFSYLWIFRATISGKQYETYGAVFDRYGKLVRIGPNEVITGSADVLHRMSAARSRYGRSDYYNGSKINPEVDSLISLTDSRVHDKLKGQMSYGYGGKEVPTIEDDIDEQLSRLVQLLRSKYATATGFKPVDFSRIIQFFTLDVITKIAYGKAFGNLEQETDVIGYMTTSNTQVKLLVLCSEIPLLRKVLLNRFMLKFLGPKPYDKTGFGRLIDIGQKVVAARFEPDAEDHLDMLGSFIRHGVPQYQCEAEIPFQILAGSDTTAHAIRSTFLHLMSTPHAYRALQDEVDKTISEGKVSSPVKAAEGKELPYLQAVIYEGLRLNPPATHLMMKKTPPEGDTIDGYFVPGGTRVAINIKPIMLDTTIFGEDASCFRPERWLNLETDQRRRMADTVELIFGCGRWGCSGKPVAFMELNKIFIELLRNFDFQLTNPIHPIDETTNINIWIQRGMWTKVTDRTVTQS